MKSKQSEVLSYLGILAIVLFLGFSAFAILDGVFVETPVAFGSAASSTVTASTSVVVDNATPSVTVVTLNSGNAITLTPNATTTIYVNATVTDNNGCADLTGGTSTILVYRSAITSSTCMTSADNRNCYRATAFTATSTCVSGTTLNATSSVDIWYFADSTQDTGAGVTSTYPTQIWVATVIFRDPSNATSSKDDSRELNVLTAINVTTSSINYGTVSANTNTGATNQVTTSTNAGNSTTSLKIHAQSTLTSGTTSITTSSQKYATTTFTYSTGGTALSQDVTTISGTTMVTPTSTNTVNRAVFWGIEIPPGTATGTYTGVNLFTASYVDVAN